MIFCEWSGAYYNAVTQILKASICRPFAKEKMRSIICKQASSESVLSIVSALTGEKWKLLKTDGTTPLLHTPTMPLSLLQLQWLKSISLDPRIRLFVFDVWPFTLLTDKTNITFCLLSIFDSFLRFLNRNGAVIQKTTCHFSYAV